MSVRTSDVISSRERIQKAIVLLFPIAAVLFFIVLRSRFRSTYGHIVREDSVIEDLQCAFYFIAGWIAWRAARDFRKTRSPFLALAFLLFSLASFFVSLEEISWGQRIFGFHGASFIVEHNAQHEFTLHNEKPVQRCLCDAYILAGFLGAFTHMLLPGGFRNRFQSAVRFIVPDRILTFYFLPTFVVYLYLAHVSKYTAAWFGSQPGRIGGFMVWRDQEPAEFLLSLGILLFVLSVRYRQKSGTGDTVSAAGSRS